jgi:hypothetical protein
MTPNSFPTAASMTDIVERLRKPMVEGLTHPIDHERTEAAAEIERLRECNTALNWQVEKCEAEIKALRAQLS